MGADHLRRWAAVIFVLAFAESASRLGGFAQARTDPRAHSLQTDVGGATLHNMEERAGRRQLLKGGLAKKKGIGGAIDVYPVNPAELDLGIVMMDDRTLARGIEVFKAPAKPCPDYWSASTVINRLYAEMHGYAFHMWDQPKKMVYKTYCDKGDKFLERNLHTYLGGMGLHPAWLKILPIYCYLKKHKMVLWMDSDAYFSDATVPIEALLYATNFTPGLHHLLVSEDHPLSDPSKGFTKDKLPGPAINTGIMLFDNSEQTFKMLQDWMGATADWKGKNPEVSLSLGHRRRWPWEQAAFNQPEKSLYTAYHENIIVTPYAVPFNGPHGRFAAHLWGWITGEGKKCAMLRGALKCTLDSLALTDDQKTCLLGHVSTLGSNTPHGHDATNATNATDILSQGACGYRVQESSHRTWEQMAHGVLSRERTQCRPWCRTARRKKEISGQTKGTLGPWRFKPLGLRKCKSDKVTIQKYTVARKLEPSDALAGVTPAQTWESLSPRGRE